MNGDVQWLEPKFEITPNTDQDTILANIRANSASFVGMGPKQALVVGGGPSAADYFDEINETVMQGGLFALNNAGRWLIERGRHPDFVVLYDARPQMAEMIPENGSVGTWYYVSSQCDPAVFDTLRERGYYFTMFHALNGDGSLEAIRECDPGALILGDACTVGIQTLNLLSALGYHKATLYGYDSSWRKGEKHAYKQPGGLNDDQKPRQFMFQGMTYETSGAMAHQAQEFINRLPQWRGAGLHIEVKGEGLLPDMWRAEVGDGSLEQREARKYQKMWTHKSYRFVSPGEDLADLVRKWLPGKARVVDFGCGTGRLAAKMQDWGHRVLGVDFATNCLDDEVMIPFCIANLWDLPETVSGTHGVCTDVMEHIPPEKVDAVLTNIRRAVPKAFFNIATTLDAHGAVIGERLHLTVKPESWWVEKLKAHWGSVEVLRRNGAGFTCICS